MTAIIYDIHTLQVGNFVFESVNNIGHSQAVINFLRASEIHSHNTRFANSGNLFVNFARTNRYGLKALKFTGARIWATIPSNIKDSRSKNIFNAKYKKFLINLYCNNE